jgi:hypothetical protein
VVYLEIMRIAPWVLASMLVSAPVAADPIVNLGAAQSGSWAPAAKDPAPIAVAARIWYPFDGGWSDDLLVDYDELATPVINGADVGDDSAVALVIDTGDDLDARRATLTIENAHHTTRRSWKVHKGRHELVVVPVHLCEEIHIAIKVGKQKLARTIRSGCFE